MFNPREDDNLGMIACWHRRYNLSDAGVHTSAPYGRPCLEVGDLYLGTADFATMDAAVAKLGLMLPIYGYDHSGLFISTKVEPYWWHYQWDGGRLGFIFVTYAKLREWYGCKRVTKKVLEAATALLKAEVDEYARYILGDEDEYVEDEVELEEV